MGVKARQRLVAMTKDQMKEVARCSGGFLGFRRDFAERTEAVDFGEPSSG